jgi:hypothetical protein
MGDRYSNRYDDNRVNDTRPQYQQGQSHQWDGPARQTQSRADRDDWSRSSEPSPDEFRGDRSYQNAIEEERWRGDRNDRSWPDGGPRGSQFRGRESFGGGSSYGRSQMTERYGNQYGAFDRSRGDQSRGGPWFSGDGRSQPGDNQWRTDRSQWQPGSPQAAQPERGPHYGKGPKGYLRSDERIKEDLSDRMMAHPDLDASDIDMDVNQGEVTLRGNVDSRQSRRLAEDLCEDCHGVRQVNNQLRVSDRSQSLSGRATGSTEMSDNSASSRNRSDRSDKTDKSH